MEKKEAEEKLKELDKELVVMEERNEKNEKAWKDISWEYGRHSGFIIAFITILIIIILVWLKFK